MAHIILLAGFLFLLTACTGTLPQRLPEPLQTANEFEQRGVQAYHAGDYTKAMAYFENALRRYQRIDRREDIMRNRIYLIQSALLINDLPRAGAELEKLSGLSAYSRQENPGYRLQLLKSEYAIKRERYSEALSLLQDIFDGKEVPAAILASARVNRALIALTTEADDRDTRLQQALSQTEPGGLNHSRLLRLQALQAQSRQDYPQAETLLKQALEQYRQALFQPGIAATLAESGRLMQAKDDLAAAKWHLQHALNIRLEMADIPSSIELMEQLRSLEAQTGNMAAAENYANQLKEMKSRNTSE